MPSSDSDLHLVKLYKQSGDIKVLGELYGRYLELAYAVCFKYLKQRDTAQDAVLAVFELLVDKLKKHEVTEFKGWLHTVVKNYCLMQLRSSSNMKTAVLDESRVQFQEEMHHDEIQEKEWQLDNMSKCMEILSKEQKMIIELFYYSDKCYKEISEMTGMDWNKVRSMIQNGKRNLKICMEESMRNETIKKFSR